MATRRTARRPEPSERTRIEQPVTRRGRTTRKKLLAAAAQVFARDGFVGARIVDIAEQAGVALGSFYTYFNSKEEILRGVAQELQDAMRAEAEAAAAELGPDASPFDRLLHSNRHYLLSYQRHAAVLATLDHVASFNDETRQIRRDARVELVDRIQASIVDMTAEGVADPDVDPRYLANILGSMVERLAYVWFTLNAPHDFEQGVRTLTVVWARAIRLGDVG